MSSPRFAAGKARHTRCLAWSPTGDWCRSRHRHFSWDTKEVLKRLEQRHISGLTLTQIDAALSALADAIEPVDVHFAWRPQLSDSDDEMVLDAAINGRAGALVTRNIADFVQPARRFGLTVIPPGELLKRMRQ